MTLNQHSSYSGIMTAVKKSPNRFEVTPTTFSEGLMNALFKTAPNQPVMQ